MATFKLHFTQDSISKIILPKTKQDFYNDIKEKGLLLIVNKSKTFYLRKTVEKKGRNRAIRLGKFPYMSVAEARNKGAELKSQIERGINPLEKLAIVNWWAIGDVVTRRLPIIYRRHSIAPSTKCSWIDYITNNQIDNQPTELINNPIDDKLTNLTVKEFFFDKYIEEHCKRKNKGWEKDIAKMKRFGKDYYDMKIATFWIKKDRKVSIYKG